VSCQWLKKARAKSIQKLHRSNDNFLGQGYWAHRSRRENRQRVDVMMKERRPEIAIVQSKAVGMDLHIAIQVAEIT
jgi:hypothetical protein